MLARAVATSVIAPESDMQNISEEHSEFTEDEILKDWFEENE